MNTESRLQEIISELEEFKTSVEKTFDTLVNKLDTSEIQEKIRHFKEIEISRVSKKVEQAIEVIKAPVYVGLLGRYSHGKTALINEFFSIREEHSLPEGEGVVTSKVTLIAFDSQIDYPRCSQVLRDKNKTENKVSIETLKASVGGKVVDENTEVTNYYSIKLPTKEPFSKLFEDKKICLIDLPGLGSPYFTDAEKALKFIEHIDLLIVVIKITEIEKARQGIEGYIRGNLSIPVIPVLTFFDKWQESDTFTTCTNEEEVVIEAKKLIEEKIPSLSKYLIRTVAVSSKTKFNIVKLRECVLNFVAEQNIGITKAKTEVPEITKRKFNEVSKELNQLTIDTENSLDRLQREIKGLMPQTQKRFESFEESFKKQKDKFVSDSKRKITQSVRDTFSDFRDMVQDIRHLNKHNEIKERISSIEQEVNSKKYAELKNEINDLVKDFKANLSDAVTSYINKLDIDESKRQELRQPALDIISYHPSVDNLDKDYKAPSTVTDMLQELAKTMIDFITDNLTNPQVILPLILPVLATPIILLIESLPLGIGKGLGESLTSLVNLVMIILVVAFVWKALSSDRTKRFNEAKNKIIDKLISDFDKYKQEVLNDSCQKFVETVDTIVTDVQLDLKDFTNEYAKDINSISKGVKDFQSKVTEINKFLQKQREIIESEQV
ncbi:hypothetical protein NIES2100_30610 [Calothrix sp. NIES-2100]|uniref:dynamin family protein n=1 Tax=Calothrix sp. NIES-2100 TaxID=1954172 RepID=UPI000B601727|nr:hypothetical protein NIES2100_30610 [Calothrix sp. NIES-2100]